MDNKLIDNKNFNLFGTENMFQISKQIKLVIFDFDGVFTDNTVYITKDGTESIKNSKYDSMGISKARKRQNGDQSKIPYIVFSSETNLTVSERCKKIKIDHHISSDKLQDIKSHPKCKIFKLDEIAFVGNDINDLDCLLSVGLPIIVPDTSMDVINSIKENNKRVFVTQHYGGNGAVREIIDYFENIKIKGL